MTSKMPVAEGSAQSTTSSTKTLLISVISLLFVGNLVLTFSSSHNVREIYQVNDVVKENAYALRLVHYTNVSVKRPPTLQCERNEPNCMRFIHVYAHNNTTANQTQAVPAQRSYNVKLSFLISKTEWVFHVNDGGNNDFKDCAPEHHYDIGIFPRYFKWANNVGHFILEVVSAICDLMKDVEKLKLFPDMAERRVALVMPPHHLDHLTHAYLPYLKLLNIQHMIRLYDLNAPACFKHAFLPIDYQRQFLNKEIVRKFKKYFNITNNCPKNNIVVVNRKTSRKLLNSEEIVDFIKSIGYTNASVVYLEDLDIKQQMQVAHCADVLIGVQGSGLAWFPFMPINGTLVEIGFDGWPNDFFFNRLKPSSRGDLLHNYHAMTCAISTSDEAFRAQARLFGIRGRLNKALRRKVMMRSRKGDLTSSIYKQSDCVCDVQQFRNIVGRIDRYKQQLF